MQPKNTPTKTKLISIIGAQSSRISDSKLIIKERSNIHFIPKDQIKYCASDGNYTFIFLQSGKRLLASKCLKQIATDLYNPKFKRIHAKYLINLEFLDKIEITQKKAWIQGGDILPISRARFKEVITSID